MSYTTVEFSAGEYSISRESISNNLTVKEVTGLFLTGPRLPSDEAHIHCHSRFRFHFDRCSNITLANIVFTGCGSWSELTSGALIFTTIRSLTVASVTVQDSHGYGVIGLHLSGHITISGCKFLNNSRRDDNNGDLRMGGNCIVYIHSSRSSLTIIDSLFADGIAEDMPPSVLHSVYSLPASGGGGLTVVYLYDRYALTNSEAVQVHVVNCTFINNSALYGGNMLMSVYVNVQVVNCTFLGGRAHLMGGGLHLHFRSSSGRRTIKVQVSHSQFIENTAKHGGGLSLAAIASVIELSTGVQFLLSRLLVTQNRAETGGGIHVRTLFWAMVNIEMESCEVSFNSAKQGGGLYLFNQTWLADRKVGLFQSPDLPVIQDCTSVSILYTNFTRNRAEKGSAINMYAPAIEYSILPEACPLPSAASFWLVGVQIKGNALSGNIICQGSATVHVDTIQWLVLKDSNFSRNAGGGIYANNSHIIIIGNVNFENNTGCYGTAILLGCHCDSLFPQSFLYLTSSSHMNFHIHYLLWRRYWHISKM